ncbi:MAG: hypothetical protein K2N63_16150 [Lachnospiraceae bacterium]|nr:hypothetical protein [Lachnospiraceae bacterium]
MKSVRYLFGILLAALAITFTGQSVLAADMEASHSYDQAEIEFARVEIEFTDEKVEALGFDIPGTDLDETLVWRDVTWDEAANASYSHDTIEFADSGRKIAPIGLTIPGEPKSVPYVGKAQEESVKKTFRADVERGNSILVTVIQTTDWSYAAGISSTLKTHTISFQNIMAGYSIESGGSIQQTNNDGTQQIADYFRILAPDGTVSRWYKVFAICSLKGVVSNSITALDY